MLAATSDEAGLAVNLLNPSAGVLETAGIITISTALRYLFFAGVAWLFAYRWFYSRWRHRKIIPGMPDPGSIQREILNSTQTVMIFGLVGTIVLLASFRGWTRIYFDWNERGPGWFWTSIVLTILLHDAYFYWTHRLMHHPFLFRLVHRTHHLSVNPTPWASFSFGPMEALVQAGIFPLTAFLIPIHPVAFAVFMGWQMLFNVLGHTGFEFHPRWLMDSPLGFVLNTPTNHIQHHETMRGNFGIYFNLWDRLMGTNHPEYELKFRRATHEPVTGQEP